MKDTRNISKHDHLELFYTEPEHVKDGWFTLVGNEYRHASRVLRKRENDAILATDGKGMEYSGIIRQVMSDRMRCEIRKTRRRPREPFMSVTLLIGLLKGQRFSTLVEKTTEIGVSRIIPVISEFSQVTANTQKVKRWCAIAKAAMKQSGRSLLPEITMPLPFEEALQKVEQEQVKLIAYPCLAERRMGTVLEEIKNLAEPLHTAVIAIGPEGGFASHEIAKAIEKKFHCVTLGPRRFRSETAACVALTSLLFHQEEM